MLLPGRNPARRMLLSAKALTYATAFVGVFVFLRHFAGNRVKTLKSTLFSKRALLVSVCLLVPSSVLFSVLTPSAQAAPAATLNFQARLLGASGSLVPDGTYNIQFNLYTVASGGTTQWTDSRLVNTAQGVVVKNGFLSVALGDTSAGGTAFPTTINWACNRSSA